MTPTVHNPEAALLFETLLEQLRQRGFSVTPEHYARVRQLIEQASPECGPEDWKTLLCPLFAASEHEQQSFYQIFDQLYPVLSPPSPVVLPSEFIAGASVETAVPVWRRLWFQIAVITLVSVSLAIWYFRPAPPVEPVGAPAVQAPVPTPTTEPAIAQPVPSPVIPQPTPAEPAKPWRPPVWTYAVASTLLCWLAYRLWDRRRKQLLLRKRRGLRPPYSWFVKVDNRSSDRLRSPAFFSVAQKLRLRHPGGISRLDVEGTVRATIRSMGHPAFQYRMLTQVPEYLVLIDRTSSHDHQAHLFRTLIEQLASEGVLVKTYYFDGDPRECWEDRVDRPTTLDDLHGIVPDARLLLFTSGDHLLDPVTGRLARWTSLFDAWQERAILTPVPVQAWHARERELASEYLVLPASERGLGALTDHLTSRGHALDSPKFANRFQHDLDPSWLGNHQEIVVQLERILGPEVFQWLCACAVYTELHWDLTLLLASLPGMPQGLMTEDNLLRLVRLPWFRAGMLPDELRWLLLRKLSPEREQEVLQLMALGDPNKTIGRKLGISEHTAKFHVGAILSKLAAQSRAEAVMVAARRGLIPL